MLWICICSRRGVADNIWWRWGHLLRVAEQWLRKKVCHCSTVAFFWPCQIWTIPFQESVLLLVSWVMESSWNFIAYIGNALIIVESWSTRSIHSSSSLYTMINPSYLWQNCRKNYREQSRHKGLGRGDIFFFFKF